MSSLFRSNQSVITTMKVEITCDYYLSQMLQEYSHMRVMMCELYDHRRGYYLVCDTKCFLNYLYLK